MNHNTFHLLKCAVIVLLPQTGLPQTMQVDVAEYIQDVNHN